uniref:MFS domain-containing protein n=1 Tax=Angiostrongylus cantonensis TaxID=6313 RepID=A0A0K0DQV8_ANGCA
NWHSKFQRKDETSVPEYSVIPKIFRTSFFHEIRMNKIFILYCLVQLYIWTCDNFIYFGLSLYSTKLAGNTYVNYLLMGVVELPAYVLSPIFLEKCGRKLVVSAMHLLASISETWLSLFCWMLGKFSISCSFMSLFVYASEVFPTPIRNVSVGLCSVLSRGGAIAAPYISLLFGALSEVIVEGTLLTKNLRSANSSAFVDISLVVAHVMIIP